MNEPPATTRFSLETTLARTSPGVRRILEDALQTRELSVPDAVTLCAVCGPDLRALLGVADQLRHEQVGERVGYVVNRNINFTNLCVKACKFCAFSRTGRSEEGYVLDDEEIVRRAQEAQRLGATEVCIQAGLLPHAKPTLYLDLLCAVKRAVPELHVHAFSPEEVKYGAQLMQLSVRDYLRELKAAGIGSLPGTSAEILDDRVRARLAGGRISSAEWLDVIRSAHELGIPTTATIMYGHIETPLERMQHLALLHSVQRQSGGFTEFVPLSFVHAEAPLHVKHMLPDCRPGPTGNDVARLIAISRLMLGSSFKNIQTSWVKEGARQAQWLLDCGANDLGGTLMNESISTSAGAQHGQLMRPRELRELIRDAGRTAFERSTTYKVFREFSIDAAQDEQHPLDALTDPERVFGSYAALTQRAREQKRAREVLLAAAERQ
jgi:7,8-didemethyl-8-hydroxy-5-deazariboflavin synthase CofH subunit